MTILETLKNYVLSDFAGQIANGKIDPDENLLLRGVIDSMGILKLIAFIEKTFSIKIENDDVVPENFQSLIAMKAYIERKMAP